MSDAKIILKIFRAAEWEALVEHGFTLGAPIDVTDGYIHFSTPQQAPETAAKHFAGAEGLILAACDPQAFGEDLKWEASRGGALFPHLYRRLNLADILWHEPLPLAGDAHTFPSKAL